MSPLLSNRTSCGALSSADVAGPPSPEWPFVPFPATTVILFDDKSSRRTRLLPKSAQYKAPSGPITNPNGLLMDALAGAPSGAVPARPVPAIVATFAPENCGRRIGEPAAAAASFRNSRRVHPRFMGRYSICKGGVIIGVRLLGRMTKGFMDKILRAILTSRVYEVAKETSLDAAPRLSKRVGNTVWLKREDQQPVFSFKIRGAYN